MGGLDAEASDRQYTDRELVGRVVGYFRAQRRKVSIISLALIVLAVFGAVPPLIVARGVAVVNESGNVAWIPWLIVVIFVVGIANWGLNWVRRLLTTQVIQDIVLAMRTDAFSAAARQDLAFYDEFSSGRIVSRITNDTDEFGRIVELSLDLVTQLTTALLLITLLFTIEWRLTLAVLVMAPFVVGAATTFRPG